MKRSIPIVQWSPHEGDRFVVGFSTDLRLCEASSSTSDTNGAAANGMLLGAKDMAFASESVGATSPSHVSVVSGGALGFSKFKFKYDVVSARTMPRLIRCLDWYQGHTDPLLVACGDSSGTVRLVSFQDGSPNGVVHEFVPTYGRQCNAVCWDPANPNHLVAGLDKIRNDCSILLWDVARVLPELAYGEGSTTSSVASFDEQPQQQPERFAYVPGKGLSVNQSRKPHFETGMSEGTVSLAWVPDRPSCVASGTSFKWLRVYDIRISKKRAAPQSVVAHSKAVKGLCFDPSRPQHLASYSEEGLIKVWDIRKLDYAVVTIHCASKNITQISWSPVRPGLLASVNTDERFISIWDVRKTGEWSTVDADESAGNNKGADSRPSSSGGSRSTGTEVPASDGSTNSKASSSVSATQSNQQQQGQSRGTNEEPGSARSDTSTKTAEDDKQQNTIHLRKADMRRYTSRTPASFCWIPSESDLWAPTPTGVKTSSLAVSGGDSRNRIPMTQSVNRVLYASWTGMLDSVSLQDPLPVSVSPSSTLTFGVNNSLFRFSFMSQDPSSVIRTRAQQGYAIDPVTNVELLTKEIAIEKRAHHRHQHGNRRMMDPLIAMDGGFGLENIVRLRDMWRWVRRATALMDPEESKGLAEAGLIAVLSPRRGAAQGETKLDNRSKPRFELYRSAQRSLALSLCGWKDFDETDGSLLDSAAGASTSAGDISDGDKPRSRIKTAHTAGESFPKMFDSVHVSSHATGTAYRYGESGNDNDYQRLATLAVFYCDLPNAVRILQKAAVNIRLRKRQRMADMEIYDIKRRNTELNKNTSTIYWQGKANPNPLSTSSAIGGGNARKISLLSSGGKAGGPIPAALSISSSMTPTQQPLPGTGYPLQDDGAAGGGGGSDEDVVADLLDLVAMAFAGYPDLHIASTNDGSALWFVTCQNLLRRLDGFPVLRAALSFLVANYHRMRMKSGDVLDTDKEKEESGGNVVNTSGSQSNPSVAVDDQYLNCVTEEPALSLADKIAFACRFLPDAQLFSFLVDQCERCTVQGSLDGVILTGLGDLGLRLIQAYVDRTGDVQSAALVVCHSVPQDLRSTEAARVIRWISNYRDLLNVWQLWQERARFDVSYAKRERKRKQAKRENPVLHTQGSNGPQNAGPTQSSGGVGAAAGSTTSSSGNTNIQSGPSASTSSPSIKGSSIEGGSIEKLGSSSSLAMLASSSPSGAGSKSLGSSPTVTSTVSPSSSSSSSSMSLSGPAGSGGAVGPGLPVTPGKDQGKKQEENNDKFQSYEIDELLSWAAKEPQLYVVCQHCKESLLLSTLLGDSSVVSASGRVNRRKLTLPCCPRCKKRLSSCAVCVLPMSCINPHAQMAGLSSRDRARMSRMHETSEKKKGSVSSSSSSLPSHARSRKRETASHHHHQQQLQQHPTNPSPTLGSKGLGEDTEESQFPLSTAQPFGRWFSWCLRCRHGGHAVCLMEWFSSHLRCPVSDCNCPCTNLR